MDGYNWVQGLGIGGIAGCFDDVSGLSGLGCLGWGFMLILSKNL